MVEVNGIRDARYGIIVEIVWNYHAIDVTAILIRLSGEFIFRLFFFFFFV